MPEPIWTPPESLRDTSRLHEFLLRYGLSSYESAFDWSVAPDSAGAFWHGIADFFDIPWLVEPEASLERDSGSVAGAQWFRGGRLNYAQICLTGSSKRDAELAVMSRSETRPEVDLTWAALKELVGRVRFGLERCGVQRGDYVAGYLPNIVETVAAMLATASLGAIWTCCAPEMGVTGALERLSPLQPKVLLAVDGYVYGGRPVDRRDQSSAIRAGLPSLAASIYFTYLHNPGDVPEGWTPWNELVADHAPIQFEPVGFSHPLYTLFSSGTTGPPKAIIHGHGGIALEHSKVLGLHFNLGSFDRFCWYTTTGWMMWNLLVSGLAVGSTVILYDGDPGGRRRDNIWALVSSTAATCMGVGAAFLVSSMKRGVRPADIHDLSSLSTLGSTGSPLPPVAADWVYTSVGTDLLLASFSGGTDICTGFAGPSPLHPVWRGEMSCRCLGADLRVLDNEGREVIDQEGELVLGSPLPSMPVGFLGDEDGSRYRSSYFERFPGFWAHGDRATLSSRGTLVISGRSDGILNRGGVRIGTAELYAIIESLDSVEDSMVVHVEDVSGGAGKLVALVVADESADSSQLRLQIGSALREELSPRHIPDIIEFVDAIPRTLSGKKLEVPIKRILMGSPPDEALSLSSLANPESLAPIRELASRFRELFSGTE